jgi:hypothetical protein
MSAVREAFVLPALFLTATLLAGLQIGPSLAFAPPSAFSLILASVMLGLLVRSGTLAPDRLLHGQRSILANANGAVVLVSLFAASAQLLTMLTPASGLPLILFDGFLLVLLVNTMITAPDRGRAVRGLLVILGSAFLLKFVVLASLSDPEAGRMHRVLVAIFDVATMGTISQEPISPASAYIAFAAIALYLIAVAALPPAVRWLATGELSSAQAITRGSP